MSNKKWATVTGSSSGFGLLCVLELAKNGFNVIATMRDVSKSAKLLEQCHAQNISDSIHLHPLDVTSEQSIIDFKNFLSDFNSIEVLVNNAGYALAGFSEEIPIDDFRLQFETNVFGVISVTQVVLPFMRAQGKGRIINMSSISGKIGFPGLSPYVASKHALEGFSESLRLELKPFGIDVSLVEPGSYQTNIWASVETLGLNPNSPYHDYMSALLSEIEVGKAEHGNPLEVAKLVAQIATQTKTPKLRYPVGQGVKKSLFLKNFLPWKLIEKTVLKKLMIK